MILDDDLLRSEPEDLSRKKQQMANLKVSRCAERAMRPRARRCRPTLLAGPPRLSLNFPPVVYRV